MIIRRATQVVAGTTMPRSATRWLPRAWPEGPREAGIGQRRGCQSALKYTWGASSPLRGRIFLWKKLLRPARSRPILLQPLWGGALRAACLVRLLAKERPGAWPEGPRRAGIGQRRGCFDRTTVLLGRRHPATGSHLPSEDTAPPCAVAPFASSPFAHPIPQSHRRASEDLFSASLEYKILRFSSPAGKEPGWGCELGFFS